MFLNLLYSQSVKVVMGASKSKPCVVDAYLENITDVVLNVAQFKHPPFVFEHSECERKCTYSLIVSAEDFAVFLGLTNKSSTSDSSERKRVILNLERLPGSICIFEGVLGQTYSGLLNDYKHVKVYTAGGVEYYTVIEEALRAMKLFNCSSDRSEITINNA